MRRGGDGLPLFAEPWTATIAPHVSAKERDERQLDDQGRHAEVQPFGNPRHGPQSTQSTHSAQSAVHTLKGGVNEREEGGRDSGGAEKANDEMNSESVPQS